MVDWDVPRSGSGARVMVEVGLARGLSVQDALRDTGLSMSQLVDGGNQIYTGQEFTVVRNVVDALGDPPGLGIEAGMRFQLPLYGTFAFALISSATVRSAIETVMRALSLTFAFTSVTSTPCRGQTNFVFTAPDIPQRLRRFVVERDIAGVRRLHCEIFPAAAPLPVDFAFPEPAAVDIGCYDDAFGARPRFGVDESMILADNALLDLPMPQANEQVLALALAQCSDLLEQRRPRRETGRLVRDFLVRNLANPPDARVVAQSLHISDRTLRQRLSAEGTSFRMLVEEVRSRLAEEFLADGMPVSEIADRLGYRELSSFSQAFRRWKGVGPRDYRAIIATKPKP